VSDKAKQIFSLTVAALIGVTIYIILKTILIDMTSNNPGNRILMSGVAGAIGAVTWFYTNKLLSRMLNVKELGK